MHSQTRRPHERLVGMLRGLMAGQHTSMGPIEDCPMPQV